jgi:hypothetical protein
VAYILALDVEMLWYLISVTSLLQKCQRKTTESAVSGCFAQWSSIPEEQVWKSTVVMHYTDISCNNFTHSVTDSSCIVKSAAEFHYSQIIP